MSTDVVIAEAKKWIDSLSDPSGLHGSWRLQELYKNTRIDADGKIRRTPAKIRRFAKGIPWSLVDAAMRYLEDSAPYRGIVYNGVELPGEYRPTRTRWVRDESFSVGGQKSEGRYTLIQDLVDATLPDSYEVESASSCSERVMSSWTWDAASVENVPASTQGVTYAVQSVSRNEDGSFNYVLIERTALTQHTIEYPAEGTVYGTTTIETWNNVYGVPGAFTDNEGNPISVPTPPGEPGMTLQVETQQNSDCTYRVVVTRRQAIEGVSSASECKTTIFEHEDASTTRAAADGLGCAPDAADGVTVTHQSEKRPDGLFDNVVRTKREIAVEGSVRSVSVSRRGRRVTTLDVNQPAPADTSSVGLGTDVKVEKTPGGRFNNTVSQWDRSERMRVAERCADTAQRHTDETTTAGADMPGPDEHITGGVGGITRRRETVVGDEGEVTQVLTEEREKKVPRHREVWRVGLTGVTHTTTTLHNETPLSAPSFSRGNVGTVHENERTPGGLVNTTVTTVARSGDSIDTAERCAKTIFEHTHTEQQTSPSGRFPGHVEAPNAAAGTYSESDARLNDDGTSTVSVRTTRELAVESASKTVIKTVRGVRTRTVNRNMTTPASVTGLSIGTSVTNEKTNSGRYNQTIETSSSESVGAIGSDCTRSVLEHGHSTRENLASAPTEEAPDPTPGIVYDKSLQLTENGTWDVVTRVRTAFSAHTQISTGAKYRTSTRNVLRNATEVPLDPPDTNKEVAASVSINEYGLLDATVDTVVHLPHGSQVSHGAHLVQTSTTVERNSESDAIGASPGVNRVVDASVTPNEHGSFDKTVRVTQYSTRSASASGGSEMATTRVTSTSHTTDPSSGESPATNKTVDVSVSQNEHGSYDKTVRVTTYRERSATINGGAQHAQVTVTSTSHDVSPDAGDTPAINRTVDVSISQNEHGSYDKTVRTTTYSKFGADGVAIDNPLYTEVQSAWINDDSGPRAESAGDGAVISVSNSPNERGSWGVHTTKRTAKPKEHQVSWSDDTTSYQKKVYRNFSAPQTPVFGGSTGLRPTETSCSFQINDYGLYDGSWEVRRPGNVGMAKSVSTKETCITDMCTIPDSSGKYWKVRTTTELPVRYIATRNPEEIFTYLSNGVVYNGHSSRIIASLGSGLVMLAVYSRPGTYEVEHEQLTY